MIRKTMQLMYLKMLLFVELSSVISRIFQLEIFSFLIQVQML